MGVVLGGCWVCVGLSFWLLGCLVFLWDKGMGAVRGCVDGLGFYKHLIIVGFVDGV